MSDLIAFLNARLDEDERYLRSNRHHLWTERPLREVAAKRAVMSRYERGASGDLPEWKAGRELIEGALAILLGVLRDIAAVYDDHPDYRQEWAS